MIFFLSQANLSNIVNYPQILSAGHDIQLPAEFSFQL